MNGNMFRKPTLSDDLPCILKGVSSKNLLFLGQILFLREDPIFGRDLHPGKQITEVVSHGKSDRKTG